MATKLSKKLDVPPIWTALAIVAIVIFNQIAPEPSLRRVLIPIIGYAMILYAIYVAVWAIRTFRKHNTPIYPRKKPKELLRTGPFAIIRNPIYTSMLIFSAGVAVICGSVYGYLPVIGLFFVLRQRFVEPEEQLLIEAFGDEARAYIRSTRRW